MRLTIIESPYAGNVEQNVEYARRAIKHSLSLGEASIASHLLYTQPGILNENNSVERQQGIEAGVAWYRVAELCAVYTDFGISSGMQQGINQAALFNIAIEYRNIGA